jgi:5'(3')-deoxyribonucleotidase
MKKVKKILYIDMDNVLVEFKSGIKRCDKKTQIEFEVRLDEVPGIFGKMDPLYNVIESYKELCVHFDTYILPTSPWENETALADKLRLVKKYLGEVAYKRLIFFAFRNKLGFGLWGQ